MQSDRLDDCIRRLLQVAELTGENPFSCKMAMPRQNVDAHLSVCSFEIDRAQVEPGADSLPVGFFECGTREDAAFSGSRLGFQAIMNCLEPWLTVGIIERNSL